MSTDAANVLNRYPADCQPAVCTSLQGAGGFSGAAIWRLETARGTLALRRWPPEHPTPERLTWIHAVARYARHRGFALLPQPIATRDGQTFAIHAGRLWQVEPWLPGAADYASWPSTLRLQNALIALARFHRGAEAFPGVDPQHGPSPGVIERRIRLAKLLAGGMAELTAALESRRLPAEIAQLGRHWLTLVPRAAYIVAPELDTAAALTVRQQPCLRDIWSEHMLFAGEEVSGIIDLGAMRVETVATDVARLLGSLEGDNATGWQIGLAAYGSIRPLDDRELRLATAIDRGNVVLSGTLWLQWLSVEGRTFDDVGAIATRIRRGLARLETLVASGSGDGI